MPSAETMPSAEFMSTDLMLHLFNVLLMTALVAPLVLWRYRRAVLAGMQSAIGSPMPIAPPRGARPRCNDAAVGVDAALAWEARLRRRIFAAVTAAVCAPALLLAAQSMLLGDLPKTPAHLTFDAGTTALMAVPIFAMLTATSLWRAIRIALLMVCCVGAAVVVISMLQRLGSGRAPTLDQALNFVEFVKYAFVRLSAPLLLGTILSVRRIRGVAPFVFTGLLVFALAPVLDRHFMQPLAGTKSSGDWLLALPVAVLASWRLKALARAYEMKRFSDAQLLAHTWWLLFIALHALELASVHRGGTALLRIVAVAVIAYLLLPFLLSRTLAWAHRGAQRPPRRMLLVLRVFGDNARTAALFERIASRWQRFGPVTTIAGPDAAADTVDPGDLLRFAAGQMASGFVGSSDDLVQRLATMDVEPDRDGRYRINEFYCRDHTWQATVVALIGQADAVVMDLRGFTAQRHGCAFELEQLAARTSADRVVLVVDSSTDRALLARELPETEMPMRTVEVRRRHARQADQAFAALLAAAA